VLSLEEKWEEVFGKAEAAFPVEKEGEKFYGIASKKMAKEIAEMRLEEDYLGIYERVMKFFQVRILIVFYCIMGLKFLEGQEEFWDLVRCLKGKSKGNIKGKMSNIVFIDDLYNFYHV